MYSPIDNLIKFFKLEINQNYANRAIIGGFENLVITWEKDAQSHSVPTELIDDVVAKLNHYNDLSLEERASIVSELMQKLSGNSAAEKEKNEETKKTFEKTTVEIIKPKPSQVNQSRKTQAIKRTFPDVEKVSFFNPRTGLGASLQTIPSVGPSKSASLSNIGLNTLEDLLFYFPRRYEDYRKLSPINRLKFDEMVTVVGAVKSVHTRSTRKKGLKITEVILDDTTGTLRISFFNQPYLDKKIHKGMQISVSGKTEMYLGRLAINNPYWEKIEEKNLYTNRITPIYGLTKNITQNWLRKIIDNTVTQWAPRVPDHFDNQFKDEADLLDLNAAIYELHNPASFEALEKARERLSFDEIFFLQLGVLQQRKEWQTATSSVFDVADEFLNKIYENLPYQLTNAQKRAIADVRSDFTKGIPMSRLVQGDVGSGKTMVAAIATAIATNHNTQAAIMAPTSILAEQHYSNMLNFFTQNQLLGESQIKLLVGNTPEAEKSEIRENLINGTIKLLIGTHALLEGPVEFSNLEFVVIDEQHRFGVSQRAILREKGNSPHILVMTATPIPRSLALTVYGDLDISVMDEMPPGRQAVQTHIVNPLDRERVYQLIRNQADEGNQAFIIYPMVSADDSELDNQDANTNAAVNEHKRLQAEVFPNLRVGLLHGKMKASEKESIMQSFKNKDLDILVSTTVVEVGVDIPNATVITIEGANRFGLAQLHQLRGRVGRGDKKSYCLLIPENSDAVENERLIAMESTTDGFVLAEKDLNQRGPGDFLGTRQSGYMDLRMANIMDVKLIEKARKLAQSIFEKDADLSMPEHEDIREKLKHYWVSGTGDIS